jgi:hypothetical protein
MKLYHGSTVYIDTIDLLRSKVGKDFGCGFYLSPDKTQAEKMAAKKAVQTQSDTPCVTIYEIDENSILSQLNCLTFEGYSKEWAEFVLANRKNRKRENIHEYDVVCGPIANDDVGLLIRKLTSGLIDIEKFLEELKYKEGITYQYFFATEKSLKYLKKI